MSNEKLKSIENNLDEYFPILNLTENDVLRIIYDIKDWEESYNYCLKMNKLINKFTLKRIIKFSWLSFYDSYKVNLDIIIQLYKIWCDVNNINLNLETIANKIYKIKKLKLSKLEIVEYIFNSLKK